MATQINVGVNVKGTAKAEKDLKKVDKAAEGIGDSADLASGALDNMSGGAVTAFKGMVAGARSVVVSMTTVKGAIISTGIGALVVVVASLVAYFTRTERGAKLLERGMAALGFATEALMQVLIPLGENLVMLFYEPEKAAKNLEEMLGPLGSALGKLFTDPLEGIKEFGNLIYTYVIDQFNKIIEGAGLLGSALMKLFKGDFEGAFDDAADGAGKLLNGVLSLTPNTAIAMAVYNTYGEEIAEVAGQIMENVKANDKLIERTQKLRQATRDLELTFAESRAQIKEYNKDAEDVTLSFEERRVAAQKAMDLEVALMAERQRIAEQELQLEKQRQAFSEQTEEDKQKLVDLEVDLINIRTESAEMQTTLQNKINAIDQAAAAEAERLHNEELARIDAEKKASEDAAKIKADAELKYLQEVKAEREKVYEASLNTINALLDAEKIAQLKSADTEKKRQAIEEKFAKRKRKLAIADVLLQQGQAMAAAIAGALKAGAATGAAAPLTTPLFLAQMIGIVLTGFASIKGIMNQAGAAELPDAEQPSSGGSGGGGGGEGRGPSLALTPDLAQSFNTAAGSSAVQAYVVQNDIADADALQQQLQAQAEL